LRRNILIIGAGQIGSRHLQALALLKEPCYLYLVDPNEANLLTARQRFESVAGYERHQTSFCSSIEKLTTDKFNLAIIATTADIRAHVIQSLLKAKEVKYLVLEKVLFQALNDYKLIEDLLQKHNTQAFVNCPRRMYDFYKEVKTSITPDTPVQMEIIGNSWGLACNGIHFIDLFSYLTGADIFRWHNNLQKEIIKSKRSGYIEIVGNITGYSSGGNSLSLTCYKEGPPNISVRISTERFRLTISEGLGKAYKEEISQEWKAGEIVFNVLYQSQLTNIITEQLFETGSCELTPFGVSSTLHIPFIKMVLTHYNKVSKSITDICPIT